MSLSRRDLGKLALAALPASRLLAKTNSKFGGVQIGINAPYSFPRTVQQRRSVSGGDDQTEPRQFHGNCALNRSSSLWVRPPIWLPTRPSGRRDAATRDKRSHG